MSEYDRLKKIIPPDQALANQALSRSLRQVKKIFDTNLPNVSVAVSVLESNTDLNLINNLSSPIPAAVANFWANTFPTGTGAGNAITTNDVVGIAAGAAVNDNLPVITSVVSTLGNLGALDSLTADTGNPASANNGIYAQMSYCLSNGEPYGNVMTGVTVPATIYWAGGFFLDFDSAFASGFIPAANNAINSIASTNSDLAQQSNDATTAIYNQLVLNQNNLVLAGIDVGNLVLANSSANTWTNAGIQSNQISSSLSLTTRLHEIGKDIAVGGAAQFFEQVANTTNITGQAVIASMREGRNIVALNDAGIILDTQLSDVNANTPVADNLSTAQYSTAQATANIVI